MAILKLENINYSYDKKRKILNDLSAEFEQGYLYAIVGKSGEGKSTLLSLMAGLDLPDDGEVLFEGQSTKKLNLNRYRRSMVSTIYQDFSLFPLLTVLENIMYPMMLNNVNRKEAKQEAMKLAEKVSLKENLFNKYPSEISGGEQQRVAIARGLTMKRMLMLADEPTGNLDTENSNAIIEILQELAHNENRCIIVVTHDIQVMEKADVIYRIVDGKLVKE